MMHRTRHSDTKWKRLSECKCAERYQWPWRLALASQPKTRSLLHRPRQLRFVFHGARVFETGQGIPISLSVIAVAVGRRAGLALEPIGAAGHFMAALLAPEDGGGGGDGGGEDFFLDAFNGRVMSRRVCLSS